MPIPVSTWRWYRTATGPSSVRFTRYGGYGPIDAGSTVETRTTTSQVFISEQAGAESDDMIPLGADLSHRAS